MKWFKVDSYTPADPKIQSVIGRFGNQGLGMLFRLWCFIAAHGTQRPGASVDSHGRPIEKKAIVEATGGTEEQFDLLLSELLRNGHISKKMWNSRGVIFLPAMSKRCDVYSQRRVRTNFAQSAHMVGVEEKRREEKRSKYPPTPLLAKGGRVTRNELAQAKARRERVHGGCPHEPRCSDYAACVRRLALDAKVAVES